MTERLTTTNGNDWREWSRWVRQGIEELRAETKGLKEELTLLRVDVAVLKTKMAIYGFVGAAVGTGLLNVIFRLFQAR